MDAITQQQWAELYRVALCDELGFKAAIAESGDVDFWSESGLQFSVLRHPDSPHYLHVMCALKLDPQVSTRLAEHVVQLVAQQHPDVGIGLKGLNVVFTTNADVAEVGRVPTQRQAIPPLRGQISRVWAAAQTMHSELTFLTMTGRL